MAITTMRRTPTNAATIMIIMLLLFSSDSSSLSDAVTVPSNSIISTVFVTTIVSREFSSIGPDEDWVSVGSITTVLPVVVVGS